MREASTAVRAEDDEDDDAFVAAAVVGVDDDHVDDKREGAEDAAHPNDALYPAALERLTMMIPSLLVGVLLAYVVSLNFPHLLAK